MKQIVLTLCAKLGESCDDDWHSRKCTSQAPSWASGLIRCVHWWWRMKLCLRVRLLPTGCWIPGPLSHYLGESPAKTQEVKKSIDCPQEDHSRLPAALDILSRLSGSRWKWIGQHCTWVGISEEDHSYLTSQSQEPIRSEALLWGYRDFWAWGSNSSHGPGT